jgi:hypothetical protein
MVYDGGRRARVDRLCAGGCMKTPGMPPIWNPELDAARALTRDVRRPYTAKLGRDVAAAERALGNVKGRAARPPTLEGSRWARALQPWGASLEGPPGRQRPHIYQASASLEGPRRGPPVPAHHAHVSLEGALPPIRAVPHARRANASLPPAHGSHPALTDPYAL